MIGEIVTYRHPHGILVPILPEPTSQQPEPKENFLGMERYRWEIIKWAILFNLSRDVLWGYLSIINGGYNWKPSGSFGKRYGAQWLYPTLFMSTIFIFKYLSFNKRKTITADVAIIAGASIAILAWNAAELGAVNMFMSKGFDEYPAHYLSFWATGLAEGLTNCIVYPIITHVPEISKKIIKDCKFKTALHAFHIGSCLEIYHLLIRIFHSFAISLTLGSMGGAVWELVFTRMLQIKIDPLLGGVFIALAVAGCNLLSNVINQYTFKRLADYQELQTKKYEEAQPQITSFVPTLLAAPQPPPRLLTTQWRVREENLPEHGFVHAIPSIQASMLPGLWV